MMFGDDLVVQTRLMPQRLPRRWLRRPRLDQMLAAAVEYPLTVVSASAGYGKSSALASFAARGGWPTIWYNPGAEDDPLVFLLHLVHACRSVAPQAGERAIALLGQGQRGSPLWNQALGMLVNDLVGTLDDETILILDDYHAVDDNPDIRELIERLITQRPPLLHVLLATRRWPQLAALPILQARGEVLVISETDLMFTDEEIGELFASTYDYALSPDEAQAVRRQTGGWAIALQLIGQSASGRQDEREKSSALNLQPSGFPHDVLFAYLAQDVFAGQPEEIRTFLLRSSVLSELTPAVCSHILGVADADAWLQTLYRRGLFLTAVDEDVYRYHPLFHAFLQQHARTSLPEWADLHRRAAEYYRAAGADEQVLHHLAEIGDLDRVAAELDRLAQPWLSGGRLVALLAWIDRLPAALLQSRPALLIARGDAARLLARFDTALHAYTEAEQSFAARADPIGQSRALRGQALVYLDTVQPARAGRLLRRAFRLLPREQIESRAALLRLIAENRLNSGRADQADRLYRMADRMSSAAPHPEPRVLLRLGRLAEARTCLEQMSGHDQAAAARQRYPDAHREAALLLSFICALQGDQPAALRHAQRGLEVAQQFGAALSEAVAHIRLGHALQLGVDPDYSAANSHYLQAMMLSDTFNVHRTKAEAYMGLVLLHGFSGDQAAARAAAQAGIAAAEQSGDAWMAALLWTALGAVGAAGGAAEAEGWLQEGLRRYQASKDPFGQTVAHLWLSILSHRTGQAERAARHAIEAIARAKQHNYAGLLAGVTLLGPRDPMLLVPVLLAGRGDARWSSTAQALLARGFPALAADEAVQQYHPGSTLRITLFERLRVWRGGEEVEPRAWQRKKAHQLLALLLTNRHRWLLRDQICDLLWPDDNLADAETHFKVTLNALNTALEPLRPPRTPPFYIRRQGSGYRFCPADGVWLDVDEFERRLDAARARIAAGSDEDLAAAQADLLTAVGLYTGEYLSEYLYEEWAREERERLTARYLDAATTLADLFLRQGHATEAIRLGESILARDPSWEQAYVVLMRAYAAQGNRRLALATYERCVRNLRDYLDVAPLPQTIQIYESVKG